MSEPVKRRRRPAVACILCRKRKIKCNKELPCNNCARSRTGDCAYESWPQDAHWPQHRVSSPSNSSANLWTQHQPIAPNHVDAVASAPASAPASHHVSPSSTHSPQGTEASHESEGNHLRQRIRELEEQLSKVNLKYNGDGDYPSVSTSSLETATSKIGGVFYLMCDAPSGGTRAGIARTIMHKTRMFGQSHWCVAAIIMIRDIFETIDSRLQEVGATAWAGIAKCKALARFIKARRTPAWPTLQISPLPDKEMADVLVENYLRTTESLYRILHIPTFREHYNALWPADAPQNPGFIIQVKLVLALGAVTYDDLFTLRETAMQWVFEAKTWLYSPKFKSHLDIQSLQTSILLLLAEERLGLVGDSMWSECGELLRRAIFMGLHRDPARLPDRSLLTCEMHRRLWNTIAELNIQSSLGSGGPVFLSMSDFDTKPPGNFDDEQLLDESPVPRPLEECTQMTLALALRETFSQRLDVLRFLNDVSTGGSYDETLRLDHALRTAYKALGRRLQSCAGRGAKRTLTSFELRLVNTVMYRYLSALHVPYYVAAMQETKYAYSRTVTVDCSMKMWNMLSGTALTAPIQSRVQGEEDGEHLLRRLVTTAAGFFMVSAIYSALMLVMELRAQLKDSDGLGPKILRPDLLAVLQDSQEWALQVIKAGHTNVKGYLLLRIIAAQIDALSRNLSTDAHVGALIEAAIEVSNTCCAILTEMAGRLTVTENGSASLQQTAAPIATPPSLSTQCSYTALDDLLAGADTSEGWPANYGYDMDEFEWTSFDG